MATTVTEPIKTSPHSFTWSVNDRVANTITGGTRTGTYQYLSARTIYRDKDRFIFKASNGYLRQNPYQRTVHEIKQFTPGSGVVRRPSDGKTITFSGDLPARTSCSDFAATYSVTNSMNTTFMNELSSGLHGRVRNQYYSAFETVYEGKKTYKMVFSAARDVASALRNVRRGNFAGAARNLGLNKPPKGAKKGRTFSNNWLEFRYGWIPLLSTVYGEMRRQYDHIRAKPAFHVVSASKSGVAAPYVQTSAEYYISSSGKNLGYYFRRRDTSKYSVESSMKWYYRITNPSVQNATELGLTNPALLAWEAVPLSFVADWFVNVSDVLAQFDSFTGKTFLTGTKTFCTLGDHVSEVLASRAGMYTISSYSPSTLTCRTVSVSRTVLTSAPSVRLQISNGLIPKRIVDAVSLIRQRAR